MSNEISVMIYWELQRVLPNVFPPSKILGIRRNEERKCYRAENKAQNVPDSSHRLSLNRSFMCEETASRSHTR